MVRLCPPLCLTFWLCAPQVKLDKEARLDLAVQVARGVCSLHMRGDKPPIVHADIKPE